MSVQNVIRKLKEITPREGGKFSLKTTNGESYSFKQFKADGGVTMQYNQAFVEKGVLTPETVIRIGYEDKEYNGNKYKQLVSVYPYTPKPGEVVDYGSGENARPGTVQLTTERSTNESIIRQVAFKGAVELIAAGKLEPSKLEASTDRFVEIIKGSKPKPVEEVPVIDESVPAGADLQDLSVEDIPF